ncbi:MAG: hypothetical protein R3220_08050, partial [Balneolaceae bacterium]|nr:hypothetical protein [Balneolaceae bacterium]
MSKLLVWSIRNFGGSFKDVPIYSYQPRKDFKISKKTAQFFEKNEVEIVDEVLNKDFANYPLANKPLAASHRESHTKSDNLIFLDSDIFFLNEPVELVEFEGKDVIVRPVSYKNIGSHDFDDENALYWQQLYDLLGVEARRKIRSSGDEKEILEYYNSGHIVTKTSNNLFNRWNENFKKVMQHNLMPGGDLFYVEQSVFSATVSQ